MKKKLLVKGQVHGTYIICEDETGMYLVDQHAAQERINYEYFLDKYQHLNLSMRDLLVPITLEYPLSEFLIIEERKQLLVAIHQNISTNSSVENERLLFSRLVIIALLFWNFIVFMLGLSAIVLTAIYFIITKNLITF